MPTLRSLLKNNIPNRIFRSSSSGIMVSNNGTTGTKVAAASWSIASLLNGTAKARSLRKSWRPFKRLINPGTGEIPPNALQVAPFAGPETLASSSNDVCNGSKADVISRGGLVR